MNIWWTPGYLFSKYALKNVGGHKQNVSPQRVLLNVEGQHWKKVYGTFLQISMCSFTDAIWTEKTKGKRSEDWLVINKLALFSSKGVEMSAICMVQWPLIDINFHLSESFSDFIIGNESNKITVLCVLKRKQVLCFVFEVVSV